MNVFSHPDFDGHERVLFGHDPKSGLKAIIAIHNTNRGPALGGCRMWPYASEAEALKDVLRLSKGMTYKSALANLPLGGGKAVILGSTGRNFAAGMSGGVAYVLDKNQDFAPKCNMEMVSLETVETDAESAELKALIIEHFEATGSDVASDLLSDWENKVKQFVKVMPVDYKRMQGYMNDVRASGEFDSEYDIAVKAFDIHLNNIASAKA